MQFFTSSKKMSEEYKPGCLTCTTLGLPSRNWATPKAFFWCWRILTWSVLIPLLARKQSNGDGIAPAAKRKKRFHVSSRQWWNRWGHLRQWWNGKGMSKAFLWCCLILTWSVLIPLLARKQSNGDGFAPAVIRKDFMLLQSNNGTSRGTQGSNEMGGEHPRQ